MHALNTLRYKLTNALQNLNPTDLRGDVTAIEAMAYVATRSNEFNTFEPISAKPSTEHGETLWEVRCILNGTETCDWWCWAESGNDARGNGRVYGEW